ncbi:MAG: hypothetical protein ACI91G_001548 [Gammaproteobacteria bacterium]|jgi:hypothetical protein
MVRQQAMCFKESESLLYSPNWERKLPAAENKEGQYLSILAFFLMQTLTTS